MTCQDKHTLSCWGGIAWFLVLVGIFPSPTFLEMSSTEGGKLGGGGS